MTRTHFSGEPILQHRQIYGFPHPDAFYWDPIRIAMNIIGYAMFGIGARYTVLRWTTGAWFSVSRR